MELEVYFEARKDFGEERGFGRFWEVWEWQGNVVFFALESPEHSRFFYILEVTKVNIWHRKKVDFRIFVFCFQLETTREVFR